MTPERALVIVAGILAICLVWIVIVWIDNARANGFGDKRAIRKATKDLKDKTEDLRHALEGVNAKEN